MKIVEILLTERIYSDNENLIFTVQSHREASDDEQISTFTKKHPYETRLKGIDGTIYSLFNYVSSPEITKLLSSIKGKGPYKLNPKQLDTFLIQCTIASSYVLEKVNPDVIIYPRSSSDLLASFVKKLTEKRPSIKVLSDAFFKKAVNAADVEPLINTKHPDWEKFSTDHPDEVKKLRQSLSKMLQDKGNLELKKLYKPYLKFIKNFVEMKDAYQVLENVLEKNVLIIDDILSSGATMSEMIRQITEMEPKLVSGLTIFKHTSRISP